MEGKPGILQNVLFDAFGSFQRKRHVAFLAEVDAGDDADEKVVVLE